MNRKLLPAAGLLILFFWLTSAVQAQVGINNTNPRTSLDVDGALSLREGNRLNLGINNNNIDLGTTPYSVYRIDGPSGDFRIGGLVPTTDADGQVVVLENTTVYDMTIRHNAGSSAVNRIFCAGGRDLVLSGQYSTVTLVYNNTQNRWIVTNYSDNRYGDNVQSVKGTSDTSVNSTSYEDMADMSITFTPNHSTIYVSFSASGYMDLSGSFIPEGAYSLFRLVNVTAGDAVEAGFSGMVTDYNSDFGWETIGTGFSVSLAMFPVSVTPGVEVTLKITWARDAAFAAASLLNNVNSEPDWAHRVMTIWD